MSKNTDDVLTLLGFSTDREQSEAIARAVAALVIDSVPTCALAETVEAAEAARTAPSLDQFVERYAVPQNSADAIAARAADPLNK